GAPPGWRPPAAPGQVAGLPGPRSAPAGALPVPAILLGVGGLGLVVGALLPWISVLVVDVAGTSSIVRWGWIALVGGLLALLAAIEEASGSFGPSARPTLRFGAVIGGIGGIAAGLLVLSRLRSVAAGISAAALPADPNTLAGVGQQFLQALTPHAGAGLWVAMAGGAVAVAGGVMALFAP
ncbi:MAG: hypothetical protein M3N21_07920, partial [Actinomycetota bacterium]|nr:hypothetical protein [Actinomycetota bacterium]